MGWEYIVREFGTNATMNAAMELNSLGSAGWEVCGVAAADKTLGFNAVIYVLKRETPDPAPPADRTPAWHPDPHKVARLRWWNGIRWAEQTDGAWEGPGS